MGFALSQEIVQHITTHKAVDLDISAGQKSEQTYFPTILLTISHYVHFCYQETKNSTHTTARGPLSEQYDLQVVLVFQQMIKAAYFGMHFRVFMLDISLDKILFYVEFLTEVCF